MNHRTSQAELFELIDRMVANGVLDRVETSRLETLLKDPKLRRQYILAMGREAHSPAAIAAASKRRKKKLRLSAPRISRRLAMSVTVAASVLFGVTGYQLGLPGSADDRDDIAMVSDSLEAKPFVRVTGMVGVAWTPEMDAEPVIQGHSVVAKKLAFDSGIVELSYESGVRLTIEGPAEFNAIDGQSGFLRSGKIVTYVPPGAEGFTVDYPNGKVVDLGTEFALQVDPAGRAELGVFDGEVKLKLPGKKGISLFKRDAVVHDEANSQPLSPVPFDSEKFIRRLPARDFRWEINSTSPKIIEFDVSHLVWKPSSYRAIFKWINGPDAIEIRKIELLRDDEVIISNAESGITGKLHITKNNIFPINLSAEDHARGRWTLRAEVAPLPRFGRHMSGYKGPVESSGILQFEEGLITKAKAEDFIGSWEYHYLGSRYVREFHPDGTMTLSKDGAIPSHDPEHVRWWVENGTLFLTLSNSPHQETHVLRNPETLIFVNRSYSNARKLPTP